jgi:hypothetical protein
MLKNTKTSETLSHKQKSIEGMTHTQKRERNDKDIKRLDNATKNEGTNKENTG